MGTLRSALVLALAACLMLVSAGASIAEQAAPDFALPDQGGKVIKRSDLNGKIVVLEWLNPECPFVKRHYGAGTMKGLAQKYGDRVAWLGINSTHFMDADDNLAFVRKFELPYPVLSDADGVVGKAYDAKTTPFMVVLDRQGQVAYRGAIDDDPYGDKTGSSLNYVARAIDQLLAGEPVAVAEVKSYGCSVKYKS